jgi:hypothetical protein
MAETEHDARSGDGAYLLIRVVADRRVRRRVAATIRVCGYSGSTTSVRGENILSCPCSG